MLAVDVSRMRRVASGHSSGGQSVQERISSLMTLAARGLAICISRTASTSHIPCAGCAQPKGRSYDLKATTCVTQR